MSIVFTDGFTVGADTNIDAYPSGSPNYAYNIGSGAQLLVVSANGDVEPAALSADLVARIINAAVPTTDQEIIGKCSNLAAPKDTKGTLSVRCATSGNLQNCYIAQFRDFDTNQVALIRIDNGAGAIIASRNNGLSGAATRTIRLRATGTNPVLLEVQIDGTTTLTFSDSSASRKTSGPPGVSGERTSGDPVVFTDDITVDDLVVVPVPGMGLFTQMRVDRLNPTLIGTSPAYQPTILPSFGSIPGTPDMKWEYRQNFAPTLAHTSYWRFFDVPAVDQAPGTVSPHWPYVQVFNRPLGMTEHEPVTDLPVAAVATHWPFPIYFGKQQGAAEPTVATDQAVGTTNPHWIFTSWFNKLFGIPVETPVSVVSAGSTPRWWSYSWWNDVLFGAPADKIVVVVVADDAKRGSNLSWKFPQWWGPQTIPSSEHEPAQDQAVGQVPTHWSYPLRYTPPPPASSEHEPVTDLPVGSVSRSWTYQQNFAPVLNLPMRMVQKTVQVVQQVLVWILHE